MGVQIILIVVFHFTEDYVNLVEMREVYICFINIFVALALIYFYFYRDWGFITHGKETLI